MHKQLQFIYLLDNCGCVNDITPSPEVLRINKNAGGGGIVGGKGSADSLLMGISILSVWQTCQVSNVGDCEFPGVCALFTGSCRPTFCGAVGTLPDIRRSLEQRQSHRYDHSDWSLEKGEDIKGVCHTYTPLHASFVFTEIFVYSRKV